MIVQIIRKLCQILLLAFDAVFPTKGVPVLLYHETKEENGKRAIPNITPSLFENQMQYLKCKGYSTLTVQQIRQIVNKEIPVPRKAVVITFDDGFKSNVSAFEIMHKYGFLGICFVATSFIGNSYNFMPFWLNDGNVDYNNSKAKDIDFSFISKEELERYSTLGIEFCSHTHHHIDMNAYDESLLLSELESSVNNIRNIGGNDKAFSYPRGLYNNGVIKLLSQLNFDLAFTVDPGVITAETNPYQLPRANVPSENLLFKLILTDKYRSYSKLSSIINR